MSNLEDIIHYGIGILLLLMLFLFFFLSLFIYDGFTGKSCYSKYENAKYDIWGGCLVEYKGKYITDDLYEKSFEKNISLDLK